MESPEEARIKARAERAAIVRRYDQGRDNGVPIDDWEDPKLEIYHTQDRYGFIHDERLPDRGRSEREQKQLKQERARSLKWANMIQEERKYFRRSAKYRDKMVTRLYKGVPDSVRGNVWHILLDIERMKTEQKGKYTEMRQLGRRYSPDIRQIDLDVNRTYRDHIMFRERYNPRQQALFHVLVAYSMYNPDVGYCQGMSQIAALLLMYLNEEEDAFWGLSQLMVDPKYAMHGFFIQGFPKLMRFQGHHDRVLKKYLPKLKKHLDKHGVETGIYALKWFFQCFLDRIPFSLTLRVWDLYLLEGERIMIGMAYTILRVHRRYLMRLGMDELLEHLQVSLEKDFGFEDDVVIDKLKEALAELGSNRMDHPGRAPPEELPTKPFGMPQFNPTLEQEVGLRTSFTEKEREFSAHTIQRQMEAEARLRSEASLADDGLCRSDALCDEADSDIDETQSIPEARSSSALNHSQLSDPHQTHLNTSSRTSTSPQRRPHVSSSLSANSYTTPNAASSSEAIERLDDSVRMMMETADLNGGISPGRGASDYDDDKDVMTIEYSKSTQEIEKRHQEHRTSTKRYSSSSYGGMAGAHSTPTPPVLPSSVTGTSSSNGKGNGMLSTSAYEMSSSMLSSTTTKKSVSRSQQQMVITKGDVVRIHVPYTPEQSHEVRVLPSSALVASSPPPPQLSSSTPGTATGSLKKEKRASKKRNGSSSSPSKRLSAPR